jgi:hypothetical protein
MEAPAPSGIEGLLAQLGGGGGGMAPPAPPMGGML